MLTAREVQSLAEEGAAVEIVQLEGRIAALRATFPRAEALAVCLRRNGFKPGPGRPRRDDPRRRHDQPAAETKRAQAPAAPLEAAADAAPRKRPPISEAHKKAIARAQRARWRKAKNERARA